MLSLTSSPRLQQLDATFQSGYRELSTGLTEVKDTLTAKLSQLLERFDTMDSQRTQVPPLPQYRTPSGPPSGNTPDNPLNVLARWSWIDKTVVDSIALGEFDLNSLPKLHREQILRNKHSVKTLESYSIPLDGSKPKIVTGRMKMDSAFPDLATFLSAWLMYISVRTTFAPERAAGVFGQNALFTDQSQGFHGLLSSITLLSTLEIIKILLPTSGSRLAPNSS